MRLALEPPGMQPENLKKTFVLVWFLVERRSMIPVITSLANYYMSVF